ncbi:hypothetical protein GALMADRAFT_148622 [Galerina marginata CBS 339.88]|uniref:Uncharacterized protein n=1 Tax=Galerina marginata (strain CBS 339.88) TaxID=685588 RepID=A0A067S3W5_GALM3|nr:hypothetical protein GALMADRAFT_148622 [Galerina marginata CBS 339.88]
MYSSLKKKTALAKKLKLKSLDAGRKIGVRIGVLQPGSASKWLLQATTFLALKASWLSNYVQATVIGASILSGDPNDYTTRSFAISSCKQETVQDQERLLRLASDQLIESQTRLRRRLYCMGSEGDSRRRRALIAIGPPLNPDSDIYPLLSSLSLFNTRCGADDITSDFDWKHVLKRFPQHAPPQASLTLHLLAEGTSTLSADTLLVPSDKQNPSALATRRILRLLGRVYHHLLNAYMDVQLSLRDQLVHLSATAHLILAIYHRDKGDFIPVPTFFDVMSKIKNVYFCVAKTQIDNPNGSFWIFLQGTDGLEKVFGRVLVFWILTAEDGLTAAQFSSPLADMAKEGGYDIMCPFGNGEMVLVDGTLTVGEREETDEERWGLNFAWGHTAYIAMLKFHAALRFERHRSHHQHSFLEKAVGVVDQSTRPSCLLCLERASKPPFHSQSGGPGGGVPSIKASFIICP